MYALIADPEYVGGVPTLLLQSVSLAIASLLSFFALRYAMPKKKRAARLQAFRLSRHLRHAIPLVSLLILSVCPSMSAQQNHTADSRGTTTSAPGNDDDQGPQSADELRKATQNPVASLISVPFQNNTAFGIGPFNRTQDVLEIEPVIPVNLTKKWMLINRIIQPLVWQPYPNQTTGGEYGFGDMNPEFFISPRKPGKVIWGVGPAVTIPTATSTILGQGKLSLGPGFVALTQPGHWTLGVLTNNEWSVAGSGSRPNVNQFLLQYFVNYNMRKGWYLDIAPIITANWNASNGNIWTVPVGGGLGRLMKVGFQPMSITAEFYGNAVHPSGASPWGMRIQIALLFPKLTTKEKELTMEEKLKEMQKEQPPK
jgi:hypothetical protein